MSHITEFLVEIIRELFGRFGYLVVFFGTMLENLLFLGIVVPGAFVLLLAGISAYAGLIDLKLAIVVAIAGTSIGDTASYAAGRFGWRRAMRQAEQLPFMGSVRSALLRRTGLFVLGYHFLGYTRVLGPVTSGALRLPFRRWYLLDLIGASLWSTAYTVGGYLLGAAGISLETADGNIQKLDRLLIVLGVGGAALVLAVKWRAGRSRPTAPPSEPEPEGGNASTPVQDQVDSTAPPSAPPGTGRWRK